MRKTVYKKNDSANAQKFVNDTNGMEIEPKTN